MRKRLITLLVLLNGALCLSQENIYLIIEYTPKIKIFKVETDTLNYNLYKIPLYVDKKKITYSTKNDRLYKMINLPSGTSYILNLTYQNTNGDNNPILVRKDTINNTVRYDEMLKAESFQNLLEVIKKFNNIYVIEEESFFDGYYMAKKVSEPNFSPRL